MTIQGQEIETDLGFLPTGWIGWFSQSV